MRRFLSIVGMLLLMAGISLQAATQSPYSEWISTLPDEDSDADGLTNAEEGISETNPTNPDCDGDGVLDGADGWAWEPALSPPRLAEGQYAVVDLGQTEPLTANYSQMVGLSDDCTILFGSYEYTGLAWNPVRGPTALNFWPRSISRSGQYVCGDGEPASLENSWGETYRDYSVPVALYQQDLWNGSGATTLPRWMKYEFPEMGEVDMSFHEEDSSATAVNSSGTTLGCFVDHRIKPGDWRYAGIAGSGFNFTTRVNLDGFSYGATKIVEPGHLTSYFGAGPVFVAGEIADDGTAVGKINVAAPVTVTHFASTDFPTFHSQARTAALRPAASTTQALLPVSETEFSGAVGLNSSFPKRGAVGWYQYADAGHWVTRSKLWLFSGTNAPTECPIARGPGGQAVSLAGYPYDINDHFQITGNFGVIHNGRLTTPKSANPDWTVTSSPFVNNSGIIAGSATYSGTDPNITSGTHRTLLVPADIAVDSNRDGTIRFAGNFNSTQGKPTDKTTEARPFRFWLNDDNDGLPNAEGDAIGTGTSDYEDGVIQTARDLEDFARLYVHVGGFYEEIANGTFNIGLKWRDTNGTAPKIKVYKSTDTAGSDSYLKDDTAAFAQVSGEDAEMLGEVAGSGELILDREGLWSGYSEANPKLCLLFEGSGEGKGQLCITIHKADGTPLGDGPGVWLDLKNIKKMYQRVDSATAHPWENVTFEADPSEDKKEAVIFVHGWRMSPEGAGNFAESMYKRMWHRGFKGRFAAFHWDTWWHNSAEWVPWVGGAIDAYLANYNDSEYTAWQGAASGLRTFVSGLSFEKKNLIAHSMGNIVAGEALRQGMPVNNYALLNAAVPSACYDEDETRIRQTTQYTHSAGPLFFSMWDSQTPDNDTDPATRNLAYRGTFKDIGTSTTLINFFLPEDQATSFAWEVNNDQTKPPMNNGQQSNASLVTNFEYDPSGQPAEKLWKFAISALYPSYYITYKPEAMAYACRTWGKAVGAWGTTQGAVNGGAVNMKDAAFGSPRGFDTEHSAEFNRRIQQLQPFYDRLLDELEVKRNTP